jgi:phage terminase large subunit
LNRKWMMTAQAQTAKIPTYDFTSPKLYNAVYMPLFQNKSRFLHLFGSAGSGKSAFGFQKEIVRSYRPERRNRKTMVVRETYNTLKDSCYSDLKTIISDWSLEDDFEILKSPLSITNKKSGVEFIFRGLDDVEKIKSVKGVDRIIIEEATEIKEISDLDQLSLRLRGFSEVQITLMYNPIDEHHWLNTEIHQQLPSDHFIFKTTYQNNRFLDEAYRTYLESLRTRNPNYWRVYGEGLWGRVVEGLIYQEYEIIADFPKNDKGEDDIQFYGLDFGFSDATALVAQHVQDALPKPKLINKQILYESGLDGVGLVRRFNELGIRKDVLIIADSARPEMIKSLKGAGYKCVPCEKFAGSVLSGINSVRKYVLVIVAGSKEIIKEVQNYQKNKINGIWVEDPAPRQVDHAMDAIRYGEQANKPKKKKQKPEETKAGFSF